MANKIVNVALHVDENVQFGVSRDEFTPIPGEGELLIETRLSGANPADIKHSDQLGIYPTRICYEFFGKVFKAPSGSAFQVGDSVAGYTPTEKGRPAKYGTHQSYFICPEDMAFSVAENIPPEPAACLAVVSMTAADALHNLPKLPLPGVQP